MFSGIIEATAPVLSCSDGPHLLRIDIEKPKDFGDLKCGDSICTDGVCLTVSRLSTGQIGFDVGPETLAITGWTGKKLLAKTMNLERSVRLGDRLHGHMVTGHVDGVGEVAASEHLEEVSHLTVKVPESLLPMIWRKGSVALNGVSLTVNEVQGRELKVCLIPETRARTNLAQLQQGSTVNIEVDTMARGLRRFFEVGLPPDLTPGANH